MLHANFVSPASDSIEQVWMTLLQIAICKKEQFAGTLAVRAWYTAVRAAVVFNAICVDPRFCWLSFCRVGSWIADGRAGWVIGLDGGAVDAQPLRPR